MIQNMRGKLIEAGYPWRLRLEFTNSHYFGTQGTFTAHVREHAEDPDTIVELDSANGGVALIDPTTIEIRIPATSPEIWPDGKTVVLDIVRTDGSQPEHLGVRLEIPVRTPVTRL
ncbi:hypothetical protein RZ532_22170 [Nitratireductor aquimarinus]|uniref:hypothetical protein n=1 Tax=Nitratireductor aquimarinus TaxID=889300 RepID=UPI002935B49C|nr:hypothetical protein [Nitratireductor aquimarinus]MDV2968698.1 hypothetical protein [Nitratireductor aquimarinus]